MPNRPADLPEFANPPVSEVVLGVQFNELPAFKTVHYGAIWEAFKADFPTVQEKPPLAPSFETFGSMPVTNQGISLELSVNHICPRVWLVNKTDTELLQFQSTRFIHNWRKGKNHPNYPRYETIKSSFEGEIATLQSVVRAMDFGKLSFNQCEITYVNTIPIKISTKDPSRKIFRIWRDVPGPLLGQPEVVTFRSRYVLKGVDGKPAGRLHVDTKRAVAADGSAAILATLTVRGAPQGDEADAVSAFLDFGREIIVRAFDQLTSARMHEEWKRMG